MTFHDVGKFTMASTKTKAAGSAKQKNAAVATPAAPPPPPLGTLFREAREARSLSLESVADELMIRKYYLQSLEDGQYRQLPERVYAVGFVQSYAQLLGMDSEVVLEQFKREAYGGRGAAAARVELNMPMAETQSLLPGRNTLVGIGAALLVLIIVGIIWGTSAPDTTKTPLPPPPVTADQNVIPAPVPDKTAIVSSTGTVTTDNPPVAVSADTNVNPDDLATDDTATGFAAPTAPAMPAAATTTPTTTDATPPAAETTTDETVVAAAPAVVPPTDEQPAATASKAPAGTRVLIEALQPSWIEITDADGRILYTNILRVGQALPIPNKPGITLTTGNAAGVQVVVDGKKLGAMGRTGEVKRAIPLDADQLLGR